MVRQRAQDPSVRVLVVGEPKQGKSSLVNALVGAPVCAVRDDVATVVPTVVRDGSAARPRSSSPRGTAARTPGRTPTPR